MDEKFWADLGATRLAIERATASIDVSTIAVAAVNAATLSSTLDFDTISSTLALGDHALRQFEGLSTNSALVADTLAMQRATESVDMSILALPAVNAAQLTSAFDVDKISPTLALRDDALRPFERLTTKSALVADSLAMQRATASIDVSTIASNTVNAAKLTSAFDVDKISSTLALGDHALRQFDRLTTKSAFVADALAMQSATASIDASTIASDSVSAATLTSTFDVNKISTTLALGDYAFRQFERLSANSALVADTLASVIARSSIAFPELTSPVLSSLRLAAAGIEIPSSVLPSAHALDLARMNDVVASALSSAFDNLASFDASFGHRFVGLSDSYRDIFTGMAAIKFALPDFVTDLPPRDMILKSTIVSSRSPDFEPAEAKIDLEDPAYARGDVDLMLADLNPDYVTVLDEAFEALAGKSLGRVRHTLVSLRELITHVLHDLSPDANLMAWSKDPTHFDRGKPTRAGRYLYICRFVTYGAYGDYLKKSSKMTSAFFELMNVLHDVRPNVGEFQLRLMLTDAIGILRFLLRTSRYRP